MKYKACEILLRTITRCKKDEKILIVTDPKSLPVAMALWDDAAEFPNRSMVMMPMQTTHGQEPTALVRAAMMEADVIFRVTSFSISNTEARRLRQRCTRRQLRRLRYAYALRGGPHH